jgi:Pyridine nucleotide-disulphide oxidoreductase
MRRNVARKSDQSVTTGPATARKWYPETVVAPGFIAIGSGPAATGVRPDIKLATDAGLATQDGRIVVDEHMHTSALNVYAAVTTHWPTTSPRVDASRRSTGVTPPSRASSRA